MISPTRLRTTNLTPFLAGQAQCSSQNLRENCAHVTTKMRPLASLIRKIHITTINTTLQSAVRTSAGSCGHEVPPHFASIQSSSFRGMSTSKEPEDKDVSSSTHSSEDQVAQTSSPADTPAAASPMEANTPTQEAATSSQSPVDATQPSDSSAAPPSASGLLGSAEKAYTGVMNALFGRQASASQSLSTLFSRPSPSALDALFKGLADPSKPDQDSSSTLPTPPSLDVGEIGSSRIVLGQDPTDSQSNDPQSSPSLAPTTATSGDTASAYSDGGEGLSSSSDDEGLEEEEGKHRALLHPKFGYAVLGGVNPAGKAGFKSSLAKTLASEHPRVVTKRKFVPGQTYEPQDLNENAPSTSARTSQTRLQPAHADVMVYADYKNVAFLDNFLSPAGRLVPRRDTKLPLYLHKEVMSQIKLARNLGLIAGEARLDKMHLKKARAAAAKAYMEKVGQEQQLEHL